MSEQTSRLAIIIDSTGAEKNAENLTTALSGLTEWGMKAATSAGKVTKATEEEKEAMSKLRAAIDPVGAAINTVGRRFTELKKYFDKGLIDKGEYEFLSRKLNETTEELSGVAQAQREAEKAGKLAASQQEAQAQAFQRMLDKIDPLAAALRNLDQQQEDLNAALSAGKLNTSQFDTYSKKLQETRREVTGEAQAEREAAKAHDEQRAALQRLVAQLDPVGEGFRRLAEQQKQLDSAKSSGLLSPESYTKLSGTLGEMRTELEKTQAQLGKTGMSAKQTAFAMRMIPAQMTDIVVGLSTGQSPFMVLMQQGGQLKDMFGGIGPAIKGVGCYVMGLINPFTLAAAAVGVLGVAYYKGTQEQDAFNKSLILTGNLVGKTSGQLADIAARAGVAADSTTGKAASALNLLVESGKVAGDSLERVTTAVVKTSEATGIATDQLVGDFNEIANDPVAAITKLNDQYHFLTLSTYNQIKALQEEGNQQEAARVATDAYANTMQQRANDIHENLGLLERGWNSVTNAIKGATDALLDFGREKGPSERLAEIRKEIDWIDKAAGGKLFFGERKNELEAELNNLQSQITTESVLTGIISNHDKAEQKRIKTQQEADRVNQQFLSNADKRNKAIEQQQKFLDAGAISADQYEKNVSRINEMYKDPKTPGATKGKAVTEDAGQRMIDQLNQQNALLVTQAEATNKLSSSEQELIKWRQQLSTLETRSPSQLTTAQKSLLLRKDEITSLMERNAQQEKNNRLMKEATELASYRSTLERGLENLRASYAVQDSGFGMGEKEQKRMQELLQLDQKYNAQRQQLDRDYADKSKGMSEETYNAKSQMLTDALNREKEIMQQHYASLDAMNNDWQGGIEQGFRNWMDTASTYSTQMSGVVQGAMSGLVDTMADGLSGSKADWNEWSMSVLKSLQKVLLNAMIVNGIKSMQGASIWGSLFGSANSGGSTPSGAYGSASSGLDFFKQNAKGGVYDSPSLSAYSGGVFDSPKLFAFAKGAGVFGEAGPEAIMPLARTPDGNLGVRMMGEQGGGFSGDIIVQQTIHVSGNGDAALNRAMEEAARKGANDGARQARQEMLQDFQSRGQGRRLLGV
ncbi:phage tail tape measure protein [Citrobacter sp. wls828]|uniref:phage tail tape measure protein n=1 Tax=Citrobacter youngae TaxID=133448 RepID=UPI0010C94879|nr:phage tail tape measure protein [Citrobacter youngae]MEB0864176.1 phage tail tape measure protein [Citrobacter youngae]TKU05693.1 phage tail tape measure protein [Citrobacter sp. wls828]HEF0085343.1 phage tail tape measure protein [Citrobacter youngae]HEF0094373.1 phage tail tape measure protein [Citrobacter youngae]